MLLSLLYSCLVKSSSESYSEKFESMVLSDKQDNDSGEENIDSNYVTQIGSMIPLICEDFEVSSSEDELLDYPDEYLPIKQNILQKDGIFDDGCLKEDELTLDIENLRLTEIKEKEPNIFLAIKKKYDRVQKKDESVPNIEDPSLLDIENLRLTEIKEKEPNIFLAIKKKYDRVQKKDEYSSFSNEFTYCVENSEQDTTE
jgi:hypothetical protein